MKGNIFIAWSGNNIIANQVKNLLENEDYTAIVGGAAGNTSADELFVGATVLKQIDMCNQAIFVVQKKDDDNISSNLMFELGYSLARFNAKKIHVFYVDISVKDDKIPSDIQGIWAHYLSSDANTNIAEEIVREFLAKQKNIVPENKMSIIDSYYSLKDKFSNYTSSPYCSEYELAQYVLFFGQAAYMFDNESEGKNILRKLIENLPCASSELTLAIRFSRCYLEIFTYWKKDGNLLFLNGDDFGEISLKMAQILKKVQMWPENDFSLWFLLFIYDAINYTHVLHSFCPTISEKTRKEILNSSLYYANKCLETAAKLAPSATNQPCVQLFQAYMYRNIANYHINTNGSQDDIQDYLTRSFDARSSLLEYYEDHTPNAHLFETFEMEYYLALAEMLTYVNNDEQVKLFKNQYTSSCEKYLNRVKMQHSEKSHFIEKIEQYVHTDSNTEGKQ